MDDGTKKLIAGLMCCQYRERPGQKCNVCPYHDKKDKCLHEILFDALSYIIGCEVGEMMFENIADIEDIPLGFGVGEINEPK